jgi:hypothetical protein
LHPYVLYSEWAPGIYAIHLYIDTKCDVDCIAASVCAGNPGIIPKKINGNFMKKAFIILIHAFIGWVLCAAVIGIGFQITGEQNTLIAHALSVPVIFGIISRFYFKRFHHVSPLQMAFICLGFAFFMDFFLIAMLIQKNFVMFKSILGTWIPFILIFLSTYFVGKKVTNGV